MQYLQLTISYHNDSAATSLRDEDLSDWLIAELGPLGFDSFEQDAYGSQLGDEPVAKVFITKRRGGAIVVVADSQL